MLIPKELTTEKKILNSGLKRRYEAILGFAESAENKAILTEITGFA